jgi:hypothetical protein
MCGSASAQRPNRKPAEPTVRAQGGGAFGVSGFLRPDAHGVVPVGPSPELAARCRHETMEG